MRELTRVATPETEAIWLDAARGQTVRETERMVAGLERGDLPGYVVDRSQQAKPLCFEVSPATYALIAEARKVACQQAGEVLDDDQLLATMARALLGGARDDGRANYQLAVSRCDDCGRHVAEANGESIQLDAATVEAINCEVQDITPAHGGPATQTIPPAVRRAVIRAHHNRCAVPGCSSAIWIDAHHIRPRARGGDHDPANLVPLCSTHHRRVHDGSLRIDECDGRLRFAHADGTPYGSGFGAALPSTGCEQVPS